MPQDPVKQWRSNFASAMKRNRDIAAIGMSASLVTARLPLTLKTERKATRRKSSARPLGMHDFSGIEWHGQSVFLIFSRDRIEYARQLG